MINSPMPQSNEENKFTTLQDWNTLFNFQQSFRQTHNLSVPQFLRFLGISNGLRRFFYNKSLGPSLSVREKIHSLMHSDTKININCPEDDFKDMLQELQGTGELQKLKVFDYHYNEREKTLKVMSYEKIDDFKKDLEGVEYVKKDLFLVLLQDVSVTSVKYELFQGY